VVGAVDVVEVLLAADQDRAFLRDAGVEVELGDAQSAQDGLGLAVDQRYGDLFDLQLQFQRVVLLALRRFD
jgi:hypothetical protein